MQNVGLGMDDRLGGAADQWENQKVRNLMDALWIPTFIGLGLLRTVFGIVACREGPAPEFCSIEGDNTAKNRNRPLEENEIH